jgi:hypothetical protein
MKNLIIDGWNLFSYEGIPNDTEYMKTIAVKQLGNLCAEVLIDLKTMKFYFVKSGFEFNGYTNNYRNIECDRFSTCLKMADEWFKNMEEENE